MNRTGIHGDSEPWNGWGHGVHVRVEAPVVEAVSGELKERAVRLVEQTIAESGDETGVISRVARQLGVGDQSLRNWVRQAEIDSGRRQGLSSEERARMKALEKENRELRRANEILKSAAVFFGAELDRRSSR